MMDEDDYNAVEVEDPANHEQYEEAHHNEQVENVEDDEEEIVETKRVQKGLTRQYVVKVVSDMHGRQKAVQEGRKYTEKKSPKPKVEDPKLVHKAKLLKDVEDVLARRLQESRTPLKSPQYKKASTTQRSAQIPKRTVTKQSQLKEVQTRPVLDSESTTPPRKVIEGRKPSKAPSFSTLIDDSDPIITSPPLSPEPPSMESILHKKTYTLEEVQSLLKVVHQSKQPSPISKEKFVTSTPQRKKSPSPSTSNRSMLKKDNSALEQLERIAQSSKKRALFAKDDHETSELDSIPPLSPKANSINDSLKQLINRANVNTEHRAHMEDHAKIVQEENVKLSTKLVETAGTITSGISTALRDHAQNTASTMRAHMDIHANMLKEQVESHERRMQVMMASYETRIINQREEQELRWDKFVELEEKCMLEQMEIYKENNQTLSAIHSKLTDSIICKQLKMIKALDRVADAVQKSAERMSTSQENVVSGIVKTEECIHTLTDSTRSLTTYNRSLVESTEALHKSNIAALETAKSTENVLQALVTTLNTMKESAVEVQRREFKTPVPGELLFVFNMQVNIINRILCMSHIK